MKKPLLFGSGLICLDIIKPIEGQPQIAVGGSCGNVLMILSKFGWQTVPLARIGNDDAGKHIVNEFIKQGIHTKFTFKNTKTTPIIVENLINRKKHFFRLKCDNCNYKFGTPRLLTSKTIRTDLNGELDKFIEIQKNGAMYFYLDRISHNLLPLIKRMKINHDATIIVEPPNLSFIKQFPELFDYIDILKYALSKRTRLLSPPKEIPIIIRTEGLNGSTIWFEGVPEKVDAFPAKFFVDAAGAGDWTTAGFLHYLVKKDLEIDLKNKHDLIKAVQFGQALASIKCSYIGPRTVLDVYSVNELEQMAYQIMKGQDIVLQPLDQKTMATEIKCPKCKLNII